MAGSGWASSLKSMMAGLLGPEQERDNAKPPLTGAPHAATAPSHPPARPSPSAHSPAPAPAPAPGRPGQCPGVLGTQLQVNKVVAGRQTGPAGAEGGAEGMGGEGGAGGVGGGRGGGGTSALKGVDKKLAMVILDEVLDSSPGVAFEDIVGLALILKSTLCK